MGNVYSSSGDYQKALEYYKKALEKRRTIGDKKGEAVALNNIAGLFVYSDDYSKALEYFNQSMDINKSAGIPCDVQEENIGEVYLLKGDLEKAYEKFSKLNDSIILGRYYLKKKEYGKAKVQFSKELSVYEKKRQADYLLAVYIGLGLSEEGVKNYEEGKKYYLKAVELIEHQRELLSQTQRKNFFEGKVLGFSRLTPYEGLVRIYHYLNLDSEGFLYGESTKARVFSEEMGRKSEGTEYKLPSDITKKERDLIQDIASVYKQIDSAYENNNQEKIKELEAELKQLKSEEETFISSLRKDYPEYASIMYPKPLKAEEINLKDGELLIEYEVTESNTFAWLVRKGKLLKTFDIQIDREDLEDLVKEYRTCFENVTEESDLGDFKPEKGKKLYELLLKDILSEAGKDKIIIIPDGILGILPFEGLVMEMPQNVQMKEGKYGPSPEGITYVGDSYVISYYQSASALTVMRNLNKGTAGKKDLFAMADPVFSVTDERLTGVMQANTLNQFQLARMDAIINQGFVSFNRLAFTGEMVKDLGKKFSSGLDSYTGVDASEKTVKSKKLNEYRYILFATHGILDKDVPYIKEPALVLSQVQTEDEDGFLTMGEVMNMNMGADVAILSACKTGLGKNISGEGIMGMGRAFQYAGVRGVLMSLWSVEERSTNMMIEKYLESLKEGKGNREALQEARNYIRKEGYTHPFYWAPFVLVGE
ncbi:MAG: Photosystem I assembly protein Ycf3 [bacterium ADurb.Bin363]|nr:MAG: Photosystem I assembly protein Ycf3 [bacterium ADurb.Bin363]